MSARAQQLVTEILETGTPSARTHQLVTEVLETGTPLARVHQAVVEILGEYVDRVAAPPGWIGVTGSGAIFSATLTAGAPASITLTGAGATQVFTTVQVTVAGSPASIILTGLPASILSYSVRTTRSTEHIPCGHWHDGQSDNPVWEFTKQHNLPVEYHEDPKYPRVCGHWHQPVTIDHPISCIEYISECTASDAEEHGLYKSSESAFLIGNRMVCGSINGTFFEVDTDLMGVVVTQTLGDITNIYQLEYIDDNNFIALVKCTGYVGKWLQQVSRSGSSFGLVGDALYCGLVVTGSDGQKYGALNCLNVSAGWIGYWEPITGALWATGFELLSSGYSGYVYSSLANYVSVTGEEITWGSNVINFKRSATGYLLNCGPTSSFLAYTAIPAFITTTGQYVNITGSNTTIGPNEVMTNGDENYRLLRCTSAFTNLTLRNVETGVDTLVSGLEDESGTRDNSLYQSQLKWHVPNNRLYVLHQLYSDFKLRIAAIDPDSGNVIAQYIFGDGSSGSNPICSFIIVNEYVYVWQDVLGIVDSVCSITKLTLDLEIVCIEPCSGSMGVGGSGELGGQLVSDGYYIYNWNNGISGLAPKVTKYQIVEAASDVEIAEGHNPIWPFTKQVNIW